MNLVYLASPLYIIGAILLFLVVVGMLYKLFCINVKESFDNEVEMAGVLEQIDDFDEEGEDEDEEESEYDGYDMEGEDEYDGYDVEGEDEYDGYDVEGEDDGYDTDGYYEDDDDAVINS